VTRVRLGPLRPRWVAVLRDYQEGRQFVDEQVQGPFAQWVHTHRFLPAGECESVLEDEIEYRLPCGALGQLLGGGYVHRRLERLFRFRAARIAHDLARHRVFAGRGPQRVIVSGSSGLIGRALCRFLTSGGHRVDRLVRRTPGADTTDVQWWPDRGELHAPALAGADAVVHLAGESIGAGRWTPERKKAILESRVAGTRLLCETLARLQQPPRVLISSSALGYYGDRGDELLDETSPPGPGFLADVCQAWESATEPARRAGIRVVNLRTGMVLSRVGGALASMLTPFGLGVGGALGTGRQWTSWIALDDLLGAIHHLLFAEGLSGPVNAVAPNPVTNAELSRPLGHVLRRPTFARVPGPVLRLVLGERGQALLLDSTRAQPARLQTDGFAFFYPQLEGLLRTEWAQAT
jgi:uncharacterized protein (TIGR01777 family)